MNPTFKQVTPIGFAERLIADDLRSAEHALDQQIGTGIELTALRNDGKCTEAGPGVQ